MVHGSTCQAGARFQVSDACMCSCLSRCMVANVFQTYYMIVFQLSPTPETSFKP
jgi:hypothetical protein